MSDYKALYRKWRPYDFDDVSGQNAITDILKYEVLNGKISHAYLFCGSRGTGKTSCAKILAKAVNCLSPRGGNPCNECEACRSIDSGAATDVIEMDAASNNGVGDVRTLKDEIAFTPAVLKYRVYIIDEVHMMSGAAFNALLKTLEEPPSYVVFILATTEYNKLPTTIVSRCQRFDFRRMSSDVIIERLFKISKAEGIDLGEDGARLIARASRGGMRDAVSLLELCAASLKHIDASLVSSTIGMGDRSTVYSLIDAVGKSDYDTVYKIIDNVVMGSGDISVFWQEIIDSYRDIMVLKNSGKAKEYLDLTDVEFNSLKEISKSFTMSRLSYHCEMLESALTDMQRATNSKRSIAEIALTKMCDPKLIISPEALALRVEQLEKQISMLKLGVPIAEAAQKNEPPVTKKDSSEQEKKKAPQVLDSENANADKKPYSRWQAVVERIGEIKRSLASQFNAAKVYTVGDNRFVVEMKPFFASRLTVGTADYAILRGVIAEIEGKNQDLITVSVVSEEDGTRDNIANELESMFK